jgi:hypothetical protein
VKGLHRRGCPTKAIDSEASKFDHEVRRQLWERQRYPNLVRGDFIESLRQMVDNVSRMVEDVSQAEVADISEGGTRLVYHCTWEMVPDSRIGLSLVWSAWSDETLEIEAEVYVTATWKAAWKAAWKARLRPIPVGASFSRPRRWLSKRLNEILRKESSGQALRHRRLVGAPSVWPGA